MSVDAARLRRRIRFGAPVVAALLVVGLVGAMALTPTRDLFRQKQRIAGMSEDLARTRAANASLQRRIHRLEDPDYIEQQARAQIGLVRPGETEFIVMPPSRRARQEHRRAEGRGAVRAARASAPDDGFLAGLLRFIGAG